MSSFPFDPRILLDVSQPYTPEKVQALDQVVAAMYSGNEDQRRISDEILRTLKSNEGSWRLVDGILSMSQDANTKFYVIREALQILKEAINTRWNTIEKVNQDGIKSYVVSLNIELAQRGSDPQTRHFLMKLNETLVCLVKQEWRLNEWESFIPDLCTSARSSQNLCENNLKILQMLSEEVFDFGPETMTSSRVLKMKQTMSSQFACIFDLCMFLFKSYIADKSSVRESLIKTTLTTLSHFLKWIPLGYVFETDLLPTLLGHFWDPLCFRIECARCLNEVACLKVEDDPDSGKYEPVLLQCFAAVVNKLHSLPLEVFENFEGLRGQNRLYWEVFINQLALLLTNFIRCNMKAVVGAYEITGPALAALARITAIPNDEIFKICVEFWQMFGAQLYLDREKARRENAKSANSQQQQQQQAPLMLSLSGSTGMSVDVKAINGGDEDEIVTKYQPILDNVRRVMITRMAKPPEVTIKENEDGEIVREGEVDTDELGMYRMMRECLIYLTHLDPASMVNIMMDILTQFGTSQINADHKKKESPSDWNCALLNRLCWSVGSISGALPEREEKSFVVNVIKDLLTLCEVKRGVENKAMVASCLMYVVGQYPRFLKAHWRFLKSVVNKLFEFMHEPFPGVKDMATDTFLRICQKCNKKMVILQSGEATPFVNQVIKAIPQETADLDVLQLCNFYEAMGKIISGVPDISKQTALVNEAMMDVRSKWSAVLQRASFGDERILAEDQQAIRTISAILRCYERMAVGAGIACGDAIKDIYGDVLLVYKLYSQCVGASSGSSALFSWENVKLMRKVKRDVLRLVRSFVDSAVSEQDRMKSAHIQLPSDVRVLICSHFIPPMLEPVLVDYNLAPVENKDSEVMNLLTTMCSRLSSSVVGMLPMMFDQVFESTLGMIKDDFTSFPDHRLAFFELLSAMNENCFESLFLLPSHDLRLFVESMVFGIRHEHPTIAEIALKLLARFLAQVTANPTLAQSFFSEYYESLLKQVLLVMTDRHHKSGFRQQVEILSKLISVSANSQSLGVPNKDRTMQFLLEVLSSSFNTTTRVELEAFVISLFAKCNGPAQDFARCVQDFLVGLREFSGTTPEEIDTYEQDKRRALNELLQGRSVRNEAAKAEFRQMDKMVPGLVPQYHPLRDEE
ncbi:Exportin-1 [Perkinsus chesapeaki]|uniref:Exportin-1 n=1 Tax=Perkinsus chesapeaki TaxID=330153 RepID=A0A7J6MN73_PERCH|nr:Exportin-1 [Perkinsus chesapeaki]